MSPILSNLHMWPNRGWSGQKWISAAGQDASWPVDAMDTLLRGSRRVSELFGIALAEERVQAPHASIRVLPGGAANSADLEIDSGARTNSKDVALHVFVPHYSHLATQRVRDDLVTTMWQELLNRVAELQGWESAGIDRAAAVVRAADFRLQPYGPWRTNKRRNRRFRLLGNLNDDGFFRLWADIENLVDKSAIRSAEFQCGSTMSSFTTAVKAITWISDDLISGSAIWANSISETGIVTIDAASGRVDVVNGPASPLPLSAAIPNSAIGMGFRFREADAHHVDVFYGGGGPTNGVPEAYREATTVLGDRLREPDWLQWWSQFGVVTVFGKVNYSAARPGVFVRFVGVELRIIISRPQPSIPQTDEARSLARQDLKAVLDRIQKRRQSTEHPPIET